MTRTTLLASLPLLTSCGDSVLEGTRYTSDWVGVVGFLEDYCSECHVEGGLAMSVLPDDVLLDQLEGTSRYVVPGDPDASMLWRVISGELEPTDYAIMPLGSEPLSLELTGHVRQWILDGAPFLDITLDGPPVTDTAVMP